MDACLNSVLEIAFEDADDEEHEQLHLIKMHADTIASE